MKKIIAGNWKMHGDAALAQAWTQAMGPASAAQPGAEVIVCPPALLIAQMADLLADSTIKIGGQDCHFQPAGPHTGDISANMLKNAGCTYVIVGHSERRTGHNESSGDVCKKAQSAMQAGLIPIICIGETEAQRMAGQAEEIIAAQIAESMPVKLSPMINQHFLLAYEPVWAIGSGHTPSLGEIAHMHQFIMQQATQRTELAQQRISVLYGGSVTSGNAREILGLAQVAGVLVGGASLKAEEFCKIVASV